MLSFEIITPEKTLVKEEVEMVEAKGAIGEFGILPGHTQFLTTLQIGEIRYMKEGKTTKAVEAFQSALAATTDRQASLRAGIEQRLAAARVAVPK